MFGLKFNKKQKEVPVTLTNTTIIRVVVIVALSVLFITVLEKASHALTLIFVAFFLSLALNSPVHWLSERLPSKGRGNRTLAIVASFVVVVLLIGGFVASLAPSLIRQTNNFIEAAPGLVEDIRNGDSGLGELVRRYRLEDEIDDFSSQLSDRLGNVGGSAFDAVGRFTGNVFSVITVLVLTIMMLLEGPRWLELGRRLVPKGREEHAVGLARQMYAVIKGYVNGQVLLAALAALVIVAPLFILDISYPIALMVVVFVCGLIPMVGHLIGAFIVTLVALFKSPVAALIILAYYVLYQQIENYAIQPKVQANSTNMSPLLVFVSVIIGVSFSGLLGGLLAIPIAGCLRILVLDYVERKKLLNEPTTNETK